MSLLITSSLTHSHTWSVAIVLSLTLRLKALYEAKSIENKHQQSTDIQPDIQPSIHPDIQPSIQPSIHINIHPDSQPNNHTSIYTNIHTDKKSSIHTDTSDIYTKIEKQDNLSSQTYTGRQAVRQRKTSVQTPPSNNHLKHSLNYSFDDSNMQQATCNNNNIFNNILNNNHNTNNNNNNNLLNTNLLNLPFISITKSSHDKLSVRDRIRKTSLGSKFKSSPSPGFNREFCFIF